MEQLTAEQPESQHDQSRSYRTPHSDHQRTPTQRPHAALPFVSGFEDVTNNTHETSRASPVYPARLVDGHHRDIVGRDRDARARVEDRICLP